ncbi:MAG: tryptophan--tRNA ligase [Actinomycetota bacterium]
MDLKDGAGPQRVFSGIKPTGQAHLGNYLGAIRHWVAHQEEHESFFCIVDLHGMTLPWDPAELREQTLGKGAELLACGIDPERSVVFIQSHVAAHTELAWVLTCLSRMGELRRMVQFKEKSKGEVETVGVGLFAYPVLQAADVLLYQAHGVPVGEDQRQHVELMRTLATRFNRRFGPTFVVPEARVPPEGARIMALDDPAQKMSKSDERPKAAILLVDSADAIAAKVRAAVTDSGTEVRAGADKPALTNLLTMFSLVAEVAPGELEGRYRDRGYGDLKRDLTAALVEGLRPIRERYEELMGDPGELRRLLAQGALRAAEVADATMAVVRDRVGLSGRAVEESRWSGAVRG